MIKMGTNSLHIGKKLVISFVVVLFGLTWSEDISPVYGFSASSLLTSNKWNRKIRKNESVRWFHNDRNMRILGGKVKQEPIRQLHLSLNGQSIIKPGDNWGNIAALCSTASFAQFIGAKTSVGKLLGAPVTAMAIAFLFG